MVQNVFDPNRHQVDTSAKQGAFTTARERAIAELINTIRTSNSAKDAVENRASAITLINQLENDVQDTATKFDDKQLADSLQKLFNGVPYRESTLSEVLFVAENIAERTINQTIAELKNAKTSEDVAAIFSKITGKDGQVDKERQAIEGILTQTAAAEGLSGEYVARVQGEIEDRYQAHLAHIQQIRDEQEYGILFEQAEGLLRQTSQEAQQLSGAADYKGSAARYEQGIEAAEQIITQLRSDRFANVRSIMENGQSLAEQAERNLQAQVLVIGLERANMLVAGAKATAAGPFNEPKVSAAEELIELTVSGNNARFLTAKNAEARATTMSVIAGVDQLRQIRLDQAALIGRQATELAEAERAQAAVQSANIATIESVLAKPVDTGALLNQISEASFKMASPLLEVAGKLPVDMGGLKGLNSRVNAAGGARLAAIREALEAEQKEIAEAATETRTELSARVVQHGENAARIEEQARAAAEQVVGVDGAKANRLQHVVDLIRPTANGNDAGAAPATAVARTRPDNQAKPRGAFARLFGGGPKN